jgi:hypothetical protein
LNAASVSTVVCAAVSEGRSKLPTTDSKSAQRLVHRPVIIETEYWRGRALRFRLLYDGFDTRGASSDACRQGSPVMSPSRCRDRLDARQFALDGLLRLPQLDGALCVQPKVSRIAEVARETECHFGGTRSALANQLVNRLARNAKGDGELRHRQSILRQEELPQELARMSRSPLERSIIGDAHLSLPVAKVIVAELDSAPVRSIRMYGSSSTLSRVTLRATACRAQGGPRDIDDSCGPRHDFHPFC